MSSEGTGTQNRFLDEGSDATPISEDGLVRSNAELDARLGFDFIQAVQWTIYRQVSDAAESRIAAHLLDLGFRKA